MAPKKGATPVLGKRAPPPTPMQLAAEEAGLPYFKSPLPMQPLPTRMRDGTLHFPDHPDFKPNLTPDEVLRMGSFGGVYLKPMTSSVTKKSYGDKIYEEYPISWVEGIDPEKMLTNDKYDPSLNFYGVKSGSQLGFSRHDWEKEGLIKAQDPHGWFQWYARFFMGRRTKDDERQIGQWKEMAGEDSPLRKELVQAILKAGKNWDDKSVKPDLRQELQHWGYKLSQGGFEALAPEVEGGSQGVTRKRPAAATTAKSSKARR